MFLLLFVFFFLSFVFVFVRVCICACLLVGVCLCGLLDRFFVCLFVRSFVGWLCVLSCVFGYVVCKGKTLRTHRWSHHPRGIYSAQVETWLKSNSAERLFFISHNKLKSSPVETVAEVSKFLGLPQFLKYSMTEQELNKRIQDKYPGFWKEGWVIQGADQKFPEFVRPELEAFFKPFNRKLSRILRSFFGWSRAAASNPF